MIELRVTYLCNTLSQHQVKVAHDTSMSCIGTSVTRKILTDVYKNCPKIISLEKLKGLTSLQKMPKSVGDLGKLIVAKGF